jgi:hypothetical protein
VRGNQEGKALRVGAELGGEKCVLEGFRAAGQGLREGEGEKGVSS